MPHDNSRKNVHYVTPRQAGFAVEWGPEGTRDGPHGLESTSDSTVPTAVAFMPEGYNGVLKDIDYFRRSYGYYWTWTEGTLTNQYRNFRTLNLGHPLTVPPARVYSGFMIKSYLGLPEQPVAFALGGADVAAYDLLAWSAAGIIPASTDPSYWAARGLGKGESAFTLTGPSPADIVVTPPDSPVTYPPFYYGGGTYGYFAGPLTEVRTIILYGDDSRWPGAGSSGVPGAQQSLLNEPYWTMWQTYMLGSSNPQVSNSPAAQANDVPGVLGPFTMAIGGMAGDGVGRRGYKDHTFFAGAPPKAVVATPIYNYYSPSFEDTQSGAGSFDEAALPNLYSVLSIAAVPGDPTNYLFGSTASGVNPYTTAAVVAFQNRCSHLGDENLSSDSTAPIDYAQVADHAGAPGNLLSIIAAQTPSTVNNANLQWVKRINSHIGLGARIVRNNRLAEMSAMNAPWPFGVRLQIQCDEASGLLNLSGGDIGNMSDAMAIKINQLLADFFLYEIMLANLNSYGKKTVFGPSPGNHVGAGQGMTTDDWILQAGQDNIYHGEWLKIYEELPMDTDAFIGGDPNVPRKYSGFGWMPSAWTPDASITPATADRGYDDIGVSKIRTIDVKHLFENAFDQVGRPYRDQWGLGYSGVTGLNKSAGVWGSPAGSPLGHGTMIGTPVSSKDVATATPSLVEESDFLAQNGGIGVVPSLLQLMTRVVSQYTHERMRTYEEMCMGVGCHNEPLCYRIRKWRIDDVGAPESLVGTVYIPAIGNAPSQSPTPNDPYTITYFDSQVKYNQLYRYQVTAYRLVVGNEYNYTDREVFPGPPTLYPTNLGGQLGFNEQDGSALGGPPVDVTIHAGKGNTGGPNSGLGNEPGETTGDDDDEGNRIWLRNRGIAISPHKRSYTGVMEQPLNPNVFTKIATWKTGYLSGDAIITIPTGDAAHPFDPAEPFKWDVRWEGTAAAAGDPDVENSFPVEHYVASHGHPFRSIEIDVLLESMNLANEDYATRFVCATNMDSWYDAHEPSTSDGEGFFVIAHIPSITHLPDPDKHTAMLLISRLADTRILGKSLDPVLASAFNPQVVLAPPVEELPFINDFPAGTVHTTVHAACTTPEAFDWYFGVTRYNSKYPAYNYTIRMERTFAFDTGAYGMNPPVPIADANAGTAKVQVNNYGSLKIVEVDYGMSETINVHDLPPMWPDNEFYPFMGVSNKVKILLNQFNTSDELLPVVIKPNDISIFNQMLADQSKQEGDPILFGGDDTSIRFEVYRLDHEPTNYTDFANARHKVLYTQHGVGEGLVSVTAASMIDDIVPNVAYYYCFRTIDKGDYISNPSPVIKIQIVDNNGRIYFINEPHEMAPPIRGKKEKSFKRYLEIGASIAEKQIETAVAGGNSAGDVAADADCIVGQTDGVMRNPQNKSFKVRLTGKDTGRKLDLNIKFDIERITNPKYGDN